jgi:tetratricopeptide (TPR) repeat protein
MGAAERERAFDSAEKLLRGGKVSSALEEFRRIAEEAPRDVQLLNRIGDSLAKAGRNAEAIGYYEKIADHFAAAGFYPKAVAIVKKAARLDPNRVEVVVRLGEYNLRQKLIGEAKTHLLRAGDLLVRSGQLERARQVFERLVSADPSDVLNRVRLAEARVASGDAVRATEDLVAVARQFAAAGRAEDAERTFRRAVAIAPAAVEPLAALAGLLASIGRADDGVDLLARAADERPDDAALRGEWFVLLERLGRTEASSAFLASEASESLSPTAVEKVLAEVVARGSADALWGRLDAVVERWVAGRRFEKVTTLLDRLARVEAGEHIPALERLVSAREAEGNSAATVRAIERLAEAHRTHGDAGRLAALRGRLRELGAASPVLLKTEPPAERPRPARTAEPEPQPQPEPESAPPVVPLRFEAPAVPLSPADHEFVTGHLTEAEVFLKYSLPDEALGQVREVVRRFPGHVEALERWLELLEGKPGAAERQEALLGLAWARRAAGDEAAARAAFEAALAIGPVPEDAAAAALRLGLERGEAHEPRARVPEPSKAAPASEEPRPAPPEGTASSDEEWVIEFEADEEDAPTEAPAFSSPAERPSKPRVRVASEDMIEEIRGLGDGGRPDEALRKIEALRLLGFGGESLDALEEALRAARASEEDDRLDEEDLSTLTAALASGGSDAPAEDSGGDRDEEGEQSLEEVFDTFKRHVDATVHAEDFRTRYDLGIAYKEMGLIDEALDAFRAALRSPEIRREACTMIALCHRERGEVDEAVEWYRRALEGEDEGTRELHGIRYDLAEVLLERGEADDALRLFRSVLEADPSYREVRRYVADLQSRNDG